MRFLVEIAFAHPGHFTQDFSSGFFHPLSGFDDFFAMIAIGIYVGIGFFLMVMLLRAISRKSVSSPKKHRTSR